MSRKRWVFGGVDEAKARKLEAKCGLPLPLSRVLLQRGLETTEAVESFLDPRLGDLSDPYRLPDMERAAQRVWRAVDENETIVVFGDYDVDGITAAALTCRVLNQLGARVVPFIPDRLDEGYGLSQEAMERCISDYRPRLVLSVDCGVNSTESVAYAHSQGIDVVVTDHHEPELETAPAFALVNPKLGDDSSLKKLSGVGIAFKLAHALVKMGKEQRREVADKIDLRDFLDLVALGTVADIVPLEDENRILVRHGLARMANSGWTGLQALLNIAGVKGEPDTYHLGFQLGPRINAAGRIGEPLQALQLLLTDHSGEAQRIAGILNETNTDRRRIEKETVDAAFAEIDAYFNPEKHFGLVVAESGWHPGVVGIVASRIARHYNRPAIVMGIEEDGSARGSCRSIDEYNLLDGLEACKQHLDRFGGHKMAAGLAVKPGKLEAFKAGFNAAVSDVLAKTDLSPVLRIDAELLPSEIGWDFMEKLDRLRPFGTCNPEPVWILRNTRVSGAPRVLKNDHLKFTVVSEGCFFESIAFNFPLKHLPAGNIDVAFALKINRWNGNASIQLQVEDIRPACPQE